MTRTLALPALLSAALLAGCAGQLDDARYPTGSQTIVASSDYETLYAVDTDGGSVAAIDPASGDVQLLEVGAEPTRLARVGDRVLATLRAERAIAVMEETDSGLALVDKIDVGAEPFGIVATEDGARVYVAESLEGRVTELDGETLQALRSWETAGEPRWLALHPSGSSLYVASAFGAHLARVDLDDGVVVAVELPVVTGFHQETFDSIDLTPRITGDPAVSPNGRSLAIPMLFVDNVSPVAPPTVDEEGNSLVDDGFEDEFDEIGEPGGYGGGAARRFNPAVVVLPVDTSGVPSDDDVLAIGVDGFDEDFSTVSSYPSAIVFSPDGGTVTATLEGAGAVTTFTLKSPQRLGGAPGAGRSVAVPMEDGFFGAGANLEFRQGVTAMTGAGPRGMAWLSKDEAFVHSFLDDGIARYDGAAIRASLPTTGRDFVQQQTFSVDSPLQFADDALPEDISAGRRLFYAANNSSMAAVGAAVSCATCHNDARNDGLTWTFEGGHVRQTPSLAGEVSLTAPVTWTDSVSTVKGEVIITSQGRMGGSGLGSSDAELVAAFIDWTREPDVPLANSDDAAIERGAEIFARDEVGCADCHNGVVYTDNESYEMYGLEAVQTRSLVGIAASAPYLHDGSAPTIRGLLERVKDGSMGDTSSLTDAEMDDLEAFVSSL